MPVNKKAVTIIDVAREAGFSVSTVSRVLNHKDDVSEATFTKISSVIDRLAYSSSLAAKSMRSRKTGVIGLIMPDVEDPYSVLLMQGVNRAIVELDYDLLIYTNGDLGVRTSGVSEQQYISLLNGVTDGVIIVTPVSTDYSSSSPVITIDPNVEGPGSVSVISDNFQGARNATRHLIDLGHRRIGYIAGREDLICSHQRYEGFIVAMEEGGIPICEGLIVEGDFTADTAYERALELLNQDDPPTAIFASNDQAAFGVFRAAEEKGINIPGDLSLVGFDNIPAATLLDLTTVDQSVDEMGYTGAQMLFELIQGIQPEEMSPVVPTELIIRGSTISI